MRLQQMPPQGYADGLMRPADQVRAQRNLVKSVPGSNIPKQPTKQGRVRQSLEDALAAERTKRRQAALLPHSGGVGPIREIKEMKGLSGMHRSIDMDQVMKTREQIGKITQQADQLHRGRAISDAMAEAEELGHRYSELPQWQQDVKREQVTKRRHALKDLVRENRNPRRRVDDFFPRQPGIPPGVDPADYAPRRVRGGGGVRSSRAGPPSGMGARAASAPTRMDGQGSRATTPGLPASEPRPARRGGSAASVASRRMRLMQRRTTD